MDTKNDNLFRLRRQAAETRAETTDRVARAMIQAETAGRQAKTLRLRRARLEREALHPQTSVLHCEK